MSEKTNNMKQNTHFWFGTFKFGDSPAGKSKVGMDKDAVVLRPPRMYKSLDWLLLVEPNRTHMAVSKKEHGVNIESLSLAAIFPTVDPSLDAISLTNLLDFRDYS